MLVMKWLLLFLFIPTQLYAQYNELELFAGGMNTSLKGTVKANGNEGTLASNIIPYYGLNYYLRAWSTLHFVVGMNTYTYDFKDDDGNIEGSVTTIDGGSTRLGMRWVAGSTTAFSLFYNSTTEIAYSLTPSSTIELFNEVISYPSLEFQQVLYTGSKVFLGVKLSYDIAASGTDISNRSGYAAEAFMRMGKGSFSFDLNGGYRTLSKETDDLEFNQTDMYGSGSLLMRF
jgi:hypothetical protein